MSVEVILSTLSGLPLQLCRLIHCSMLVEFTSCSFPLHLLFFGTATAFPCRKPLIKVWGAFQEVSEKLPRSVLSHEVCRKVRKGAERKVPNVLVLRPELCPKKIPNLSRRKIECVCVHVVCMCASGDAGKKLKMTPRVAPTHAHQSSCRDSKKTENMLIASSQARDSDKFGIHTKYLVTVLPWALNAVTLLGGLKGSLWRKDPCMSWEVEGAGWLTQSRTKSLGSSQSWPAETVAKKKTLTRRIDMCKMSRTSHRSLCRVH